MDSIRQGGKPNVGVPAPKASGAAPAKADPSTPAVQADAWIGSDAAFDVAAASERIVQASNGDLEQAYFKSITMRNLPKKDPAYEQKLRDMEHYPFAAAYTANVESSDPSINGIYISSPRVLFPEDDTFGRTGYGRQV
jgi:hypothetical protein